MSTTFDEGMFGVGPSTVRAFLHVLVRKLASLGRTIKVRTGKALRIMRSIPRRVAEVAASTVTTVFRRSGFEAAVGLLIAGGQVIGYAARSAITAVGGQLSKLFGWVGRRIRDLIDSPAVRETARWGARVVKEPWVAVLVLGIAVVATVVVGWLGLRNRATNAEAPEAGHVTRLVTMTDHSWSISQEGIDHVMGRLFVVLGQDGSVRVHGIPGGWPKKTRADIAKAAADAAEQRLESLVARGRPVTPLDLQAVNVAARAAVARRLTPGEVAWPVTSL